MCMCICVYVCYYWHPHHDATVMMPSVFSVSDFFWVTQKNNTNRERERKRKRAREKRREGDFALRCGYFFEIYEKTLEKPTVRFEFMPFERPQCPWLHSNIIYYYVNYFYYKIILIFLFYEYFFFCY